MRKYILIIAVCSSIAWANLHTVWSNVFIGQIKKIKTVDIDNNSKKDIIASGGDGIVAIKDDGTLLWSSATNLTDRLLVLQYDNDSNPEFAAVGWTEITIFDDNGSTLYQQIFKYSSSSVLPVAMIGNRIVTYYVDSYSSSNNGLIYLGQYSPFYKASSIDKNALASVDTDGDGKEDTIFGIDSGNTLFKIDQNGKEDWNITLSSDGSYNYVWAGKLKDETPVVLAGSIYGELVEIDMNGTVLWSQALQNIQIKKIKKDSSGGFLILQNNDSIYYEGTKNIVYKLNEDNGSIVWSYSSDGNITRAIAQTDSMIAVGFDSGFKIFSQDGNILDEKNESAPDYDNYLDIDALKFGALGDVDALFVGTLDIDMINENFEKKIYQGGTLVKKISSADMNGDGKDEIVVQDDHRLYLYDANGTRLWSKEHYTLFNNSVNFVDLTGDGNKELIAGKDGRITILDYNGSEIWSKKVYYSNLFPFVELFDYDKDGLPDVFLASRDWDTQKYKVEVLDGKDGSLLHSFGNAENVSAFKVLDLNGTQKLLYSEYNSVYSVDLNSTLDQKISEEIVLSYDKKLNDFEDINGDGAKELLTVYHNDGASLKLFVYDFVKSNKAVKEINISTDEIAKKIKFYDYNNDKNYEILVIFAGKICLYDFDGNRIWQKVIADQFGNNRNLSDVKIVNNNLYVSGKEVYIIDKNGNQLQEIDTPSYMSTAGYSLPITFAKISPVKNELIVGAMGLYGYQSDGMEDSEIKTIQYNSGWTLIATPVDTAIALNSVVGLSIAWSYDEEWKVFATNEQDANSASTLKISSFNAILPSKGVWLKTAGSGQIKVSGVSCEYPYLHKGWNLVGGIDASPLDIYNRYDNIKIIWKYSKDDNQWKGKSFIVDKPLDTLEHIYEDEGFWVFVE